MDSLELVFSGEVVVLMDGDQEETLAQFGASTDPPNVLDKEGIHIPNQATICLFYALLNKPQCSVLHTAVLTDHLHTAMAEFTNGNNQESLIFWLCVNRVVLGTERPLQCGAGCQ